jgi:hypothetical protein
MRNGGWRQWLDWNGSSEDRFVQPVYARCSRSCAIHRLHTYYGEREGSNERCTQDSDFQIHVTQADAQDLKDRNLGYISEQRVFSQKNSLISYSAISTAAGAYQVNNHEGQGHANDKEGKWDIPDRYRNGVTQVGNSNRIRAPNESVNRRDGHESSQHA